MLAIADQGRALGGLSALNSTNPQAVLTTLYQNATSGIFHDVTGGSSTGSPRYAAGAGYDYVTGVGSPLADRVVQALVGSTTPVTSDTLTIASPSNVTAGSSFSVTVNAQNASGATDSGYRGTVRFSSSDAQAGLPGSYTFTAADAGSHTFVVTLKTAGSQSVTVTDTANGHNASRSGIAVSPAAATRFVLTGLPSTATAGAPLSFTVTARDAFGNVATGYNGTVRFTSSDASATLPSSDTYTSTDRGVHTFRLTFGTAGTQSVTVTDTASGVNTSQGGITVDPASPANLAATVVSGSQINLSWNGSAGAAGYVIDRSNDGGSTWTTVGTTAASNTSYQDTGLTAGTTYSYRVRATGGDGSAASNTATATTTGSAPTTTVDSLWSTSSTPQEDAYGSGAYELGMRFQSDVAGTVNGLSFYKQGWMGGYTHVGHLWSSNGTLLATVTFTHETASGWQQASFSSPVVITAGSTYVISFSTGGGYFGVTSNGFGSAGYSNGPLHALPNGPTAGNGVYGALGSFPGTSSNGMNFWVDVHFSPSSTPSVHLPTSLIPPLSSGRGWWVASSAAATPAVAPLALDPAVSTATATRSLAPASPSPLANAPVAPDSSPGAGVASVRFASARAASTAVRTVAPWTATSDALSPPSRLNQGPDTTRPESLLGLPPLDPSLPTSLPTQAAPSALLALRFGRRRPLG